MGTAPKYQSSSTNHFWISQPEEYSNFYSDPNRCFTILASSHVDSRKYLELDAYSAAMAFVDGKIDVRGDLFAAIRYFFHHTHSAPRQFLYSMLARLEQIRTHLLLSSKQQETKNVQSHYDLSNAFFAQFLDSRLMYSAGYFENPDDSLERAQKQKLDMICRDLVLRPDDEFLDVGCGWGSLLIHAAERFGVKAHGCTLAEQQQTWAKHEIDRRGLGERATVCLCDYRETEGTYDKIASVAMFEHVGKARLRQYFRKMYQLLRPGGLFLNRGVVRAQGSATGPETLFVRRAVLPTGELVRLDDVLREGERAGFEAIGLRDLRIHYAFTCRAWVKNLQLGAKECQAIVGERTYRTWLLYLAASAIAFEDGFTSAAQVLFMKRRD